MWWMSEVGGSVVSDGGGLGRMDSDDRDSQADLAKPWTNTKYNYQWEGRKD